MDPSEFVPIEETKTQNNPNSDDFFDAPEKLATDQNGGAQPEQSGDISSHCRSESVENEVIKTIYSPRNSFPSKLRQRSVGKNRDAPITESKDWSCDSPSKSEIIQVCEAITPTERRNKILSVLKDRERLYERVNSPNSGDFGAERERIRESSCISGANEENDKFSKCNPNENLKNDKVEVVDSPYEDLDGPLSNFLFFLAGLVIKAIGFQFNLFVSVFTFPIWLMYFSCMFLTNPFGTLKRVKDHVFEKLTGLCSYVLATACPKMYEQLKSHKSIGSYVVRFAWGCLWAFCVCSVLFGFLVLAFVVSGFMMKYIVEEPIRMNETLNFDYSKPNPVALVPITSCDGVFCGTGCKEKVDIGKSRVIPPNHKLNLAVSLVLPESDYNRKLGMFQVRVEFLSANGQVKASSNHPSMLHFRSSPIRYVDTFIRSVSLLAGYSSESQILNIRMKGLTEGIEPTACLKVILEHRAENRHGAGIPEIYAASLLLQSELPLLRRIIWYWKPIIFIWNSMGLFVAELLLALFCCRPIIIPKVRPRGGSANRTGSSSSSEGTKSFESIVA